MTQILYRQGDVALRLVPAIPVGATTTHESVVLALGEVTGHSHVLTARVEETVQRDGDLERRFLRVLSEGGLLTHEEHGPIRVPPGDYEIVRQREYAPESTRYVAD